MTPDQLNAELERTIRSMRPGAVFSYHDLLVFGHIDGWHPEDIERRQLASAVDRFATRVPKRYGSHDWTTWVRQ